MSVEFEPVRLRRRRRFDPLALASVAVLLGLVAAVVKPWGGAVEIAAPTGPSPIPSGDLSGPHATAIVAEPRVIRTGAVARSARSSLEPALRRHEAWGIRAIVVGRGARGEVSERWLAAAPNAADVPPAAQLDPGDGSIVAIGLTFPPSQTPLDARIWRLTGSGFDWVDTLAVDGAPSAGAFLYVRPGSGGTLRPWTGGTYRIDVLVNGSIERLILTIPDRFSNVPPVGERPSLREQGPLVPPTRSLLTELPVGLFATADGTAIPLDVEERPPLDEATAWLDLDPGTGRPPRSSVARTYLPRATGLGVVLPPKSTVLSASVERLAPEPLPGEPARVDPGARTDTASSLVLFRAPGGVAWTPGVYRLNARWADVGGSHQGSWHVELRPGRTAVTSTLLAAAREWAPYAGTPGVFLGAARTPVTGPPPDAFRTIGLLPAGATYPAASGVGCGGTVIGERPGILGFAFDGERSALEVRSRIERPFLRRDDQVLLTARLGLPGLVLAAPARIATLPSADYVFTVQPNEGEPIDYALCLGMASFDDS